VPKFFVPDLADDDEAAEERWCHYLLQSGASPSSKRVYTLVYEHDGDRYELTVGQPREVFKRKTGPRGGYIKDAGQVRYGVSTGTVVSAIVEAGQVIHVWSYGPPFGGWANPSLVGIREVRAIAYFDA
jgi:hypothetical protein